MMIKIMMFKEVRKLFTILGALASCSLVYGQLDWDQLQIEPDVVLGQKEAEAVYKFTNRGSYPVTITKVSAACSCTTTELQKKTYEPGESGQIETKFIFGSRTGFHRKKFIVETDDQSNRHTQLEVKAFIPTIVMVNPTNLVWAVGSDQREKEVDLMVGENFSGAAILNVRSTNFDFFPKLKTLEEGKKYKLIVTADKVGRQSEADLHIISLFEGIRQVTVIPCALK